MAQGRGFSFQTLITLAVSLGLGGLTENVGVMEKMLNRSVAVVGRAGVEGGGGGGLA